jgi:hypothetical protein
VEIFRQPARCGETFLATPKIYAAIDIPWGFTTSANIFWGACMAIADLDEAGSNCVEAALAALGYNPPCKQNGTAARPESG